MRKRLTDINAVVSLKCEALICVTLLHGVRLGGVMFFQLAPWLWVTHTWPSSVPAHRVLADLKEAAKA